MELVTTRAPQIKCLRVDAFAVERYDEQVRNLESDRGTLGRYRFASPFRQIIRERQVSELDIRGIQYIYVRIPVQPQDIRLGD